MRVFFALWPDAQTRARLDAAAATLHAHLGGRRSRAETIHLTLAFIGDIAPERLPLLLQAAAGVSAAPCDIDFDRSACWRHNRIAHLGCTHAPPELLDLVAQLEARLSAAGIAFDRRPYLPHITLLRQADCAPAAPPIAPIRWAARDFVLVRSQPDARGAHYQPLGRWALR